MNGETRNEPAGEAPAAADKDAEDVWSKEELFMLLERMKSIIPENDSMKFKTTEQHLDWEKVKFSDFTGDMCKEKWLKLSSEIRKFRTLTELLVDAKEHVKNPYKGKKIKSHPDFPKKPLTPYFRFFMAKRAKYAKMHPDLTNLDLTKILSTKYKEMTEKKKLKYMEDYQRDKEEFDKAMAKFREEHPDLVEVAVRKSDVPEKPKTPQQLWYHHEKKAYIKLHPEMNLKEVNETLRRQWSVLPDKKRLKWIAKALELQRQHALELKEYICTHPDYVPNDAKSVLSKAEWMLKDKHDGRPTKPPPNGYSLFCAELIASLKDVPSTERMHECSRQWKVLSPKEKDAFHKRCEQKKKQYEIDFQKFVENLPDEERERIQMEERAKEGGKMASLATAAAVGKDTTTPGPTSAVDRPQRPISAMFIFSQEKRKKLRKKNPELPESELTRLLARLWSELSDKKKEKYKKLEAAMKADYEQKMQTQLKEKKDSAINSAARRGRMPDPPKTPEELFQISKLDEYLARFKNDRKKTMRALEVEWKALEKKQKMPWIKAAAESQKRYDKQVAEMKTAPVKKAHFEGEPKKPPTSGYQMYSQQLLSNGELSHITLRERMMEIGRRWQKLGQGQKDRYKQLADEAQKKYKAQLEAWIKTLPTAEKASYKEFVTNKRKGSAKPAAVTAKAKSTNKKLKKEQESEDEDEEESSEDEEEEGGGQEESSEGDNDSDDDDEDEDDDDENEDDEEEEDGEEDNNNSSDSDSSSEEGSDSDSD